MAIIRLARFKHLERPHQVTAFSKSHLRLPCVAIHKYAMNSQVRELYENMQEMFPYENMLYIKKIVNRE
jgi:hypothetical protein